MALKLYNTLGKKKETFKPIKEGSVSIYSCGPTVYNYAHIGNYRAFMCSDLLKRYLLYKGYKVKHAMNITDVDDKTIRDSQKQGKSLKEFTEFYTGTFLEDLKTLNIFPADMMPKATDCIPDMLKLIIILMKKGYAYKTKDGIYFDIAKFKDYGKLSKVDLSQMKKRASARISSDEYDKTNPNDFALWKFWDKKDGDVFWEPCELLKGIKGCEEIRKGRPGWHIECSAMSIKNLGKSFDIHTGGVDLIFPHHDNEIAQSEAATGHKFVKYWLHNEYILVDGKKMSKSLGNFYTLRDLLNKRYSAKAIRYLLMSTHYRQQLNFTLKGLEAAENAIERIREFVRSLKRISSAKASAKCSKPKHDKYVTKIIENFRIAIEEQLDDDINISGALGEFFEFIKDINKIMGNLSAKDAKILLSFIGHLDRIFGVMEFEEDKIPADIIKLAELRQKARADKDFMESDRIRNLLAEKGYAIKDTKDGFILYMHGK
ncbi:MAG: cysteine--tRNA ligase [Candidatus Woesearchaeota archaeon]